MKRRTFLQQTTILTTLVSSKTLASEIQTANFPIVISTWKNEKANEAAWASINKTGRALDAVEAGARVPEADPNDTSVGYGGFPDRDGNVTLDACIMDEKGNAGSVTFLQNIMHPISVARAVMEKTPHVMLSGEGALQFALAQGFKKENLLTDKAKKAWEEWKKTAKYEPKINIERHDTIGLLALGSKGEISGACTTSGLAFKMHGRVGDSPVIGAAVFCDDEVGGACATGLGEFVLKTLGSFLIVELMRNGKTPQQACEEAIMRIVKRYNYKEFQIGYLAINKKGEYGAYAIQPGFSYTLTKEGVTKVFDSKSYMV
jgi:N4-(beta-N-acetylglucosaminyl)-L-asparaginase